MKLARSSTCPTIRFSSLQSTSDFPYCWKSKEEKLTSEGETDPKPGGEPDDSAMSEVDESAAAAKEAVKDFAGNAGAMFQGLDQKMQIYLVALAVTLLCSMFFASYKPDSGVRKQMKEARKEFKEVSKGLGALGIDPGSNFDMKVPKIPTLLGLHNYSGAIGGKLAFLGVAAGIGLLLWSTLGKRKETWIPLGLAGAAGVAALGILFTRMGMSNAQLDGTILGWWLPLAAAVIATVVSVQRILKA
jgi:hypothetical protein